MSTNTEKKESLCTSCRHYHKKTGEEPFSCDYNLYVWPEEPLVPSCNGYESQTKQKDNDKEEDQCNVTVKKCCVVCHLYATEFCTILRDIKITNETGFIIDAGYTGLRCDNFELKDCLKPDD